MRTLGLFVSSVVVKRHNLGRLDDMASVCDGFLVVLKQLHGHSRRGLMDDNHRAASIRADASVQRLNAIGLMHFRHVLTVESFSPLSEWNAQLEGENRGLHDGGDMSSKL